MAGTLTVQNIQGPASGANANKIIIPSGQTLDIDAWTPPAGTVLQVVHSVTNFEATISEGVGTSATGFYINITPISAASSILIAVAGGRVRTNGTGIGAIVLTLRRNGSVINDSNSVRIGGVDADQFPVSLNVLDSSHNTTSLIRYELYANTVELTGNTNINNSTSQNISFTAMEISG